MSGAVSPCPRCGMEKRFEGLCYTCRLEEKRLEVACLDPADVHELVLAIIGEITDNKFRNIEDKLLRLIAIKNIDTAEISKACLGKDIFYPSIIYKDASGLIRDQLIDRLYKTDDRIVASHLLCALAMIGDNRVQQVFKELEKNPLPWRQKLYVGPNIYAQQGGWHFDENQNKEMLVHDECYTLEKNKEKQLPIIIAETSKKYCQSCGCELLDILTIDGKDERLRFLNIDGVIKATLCPSCISYEEAIYCQYEVDGESHIIGMESEEENMLEPDEVKKMTANSLSLSSKVNKYYGTLEEVCTIGGMANWIQDWVYLKCPKCNKTMKYFAQIQWDTIDEYAEGTLYFEMCNDCNVIAMIHQQT